MPNDTADTRGRSERRVVRCLCVDPHQSIFLAPGKIDSVIIDDIVLEPAAGGYKIDGSGYRVRFDRPPFSAHDVRAIVTESGGWPQMGYQNWP
jgi:hypothetical protein